MSRLTSVARAAAATVLSAGLVVGASGAAHSAEADTGWTRSDSTQTAEPGQSTKTDKKTGPVRKTDTGWT